MQLSLFGGTTPFKIDKPIRLIELFGGISCQAQALLNLGVEFENYRYCDFDKYACQSHNEIMETNDKPSDITKWKGEDLGICNTDKFCYIMTYSFPCTDLSTAGKMAGMERGSGTRSGLLWEVERLLKECNELPQVLLMENVPQVHGKKNKASFDEWCQFLESLGYKNYWKDLNAKDYGVPQNRNRCFMVSLLGNYFYEFPKPIELKLKLSDLLEDEVDEKYYLSDKMVKYIQEKNDKWTGNNGNNSVINRDIACTKTTREGQTRADASDYICKNIPNNYKLNQVAQIVDKGFTEMTGRVYDSNGLSPTIQTMQGGNRQPKVAVDNIKNQMCNNLIASGRVKENDNSVFTNTEKKLFTEDGNIKRYIGSDIVDKFEEGQMATTTYPNGYGHGPRTHNESISLNTIDKPTVKKNLRIRKLIPLECLRLMGVRDEYSQRMTCSNAQKYKQAGNGIVVDVLMAIFKQML